MEWFKGRRVSTRTAILIFVIVWQITTRIMQNL